MMEEYVQQVIKIFNDAHVVLPLEAKLNIYHHRGKKYISETGAAFFQVVNRDYCKSYVAMPPKQYYPNHYHKIKTESFYVLYGVLNVEIDGIKYQIGPGEMLHVERGQDHSFGTEEGVLFEEISTKSSFVFTSR